MAYNIVRFIFIWNVLQIRMSASYYERIHQKMADAKIAPGIINIAPYESMTVTYPSNGTVDFGTELTPRQVKDKPFIKWRAYSYRFYTLCMIDADYHNTSSRQFLHWLKGNIPANDAEKGDTISEYIGAFPSKESGLHRYVFFVWRQDPQMNFDSSGKLDFDEPRLTNKSLFGRTEFSITEFVEKYKLGIPDAGNFFTARWDDYVPELYESLDKGPELKNVNAVRQKFTHP